MAASWSGAGPTLLAIATVGSAETVRDAAEGALAAHGVAGKVMVLGADRHGIVYGEDAALTP
jgi:homoserine kinase